MLPQLIKFMTASNVNKKHIFYLINFLLIIIILRIQGYVILNINFIVIENK